MYKCAWYQSFRSKPFVVSVAIVVSRERQSLQPLEERERNNPLHWPKNFKSFLKMKDSLFDESSKKVVHFTSFKGIWYIFAVDGLIGSLTFHSKTDSFSSLVLMYSELVDRLQAWTPSPHWMNSQVSRFNQIDILHLQSSRICVIMTWST